MYQTSNPKEYEFYAENWIKVFNRTSVELLKSIGTQVFVGLVSLLLEGIGMIVISFSQMWRFALVDVIFSVLSVFWNIDV